MTARHLGSSPRPSGFAGDPDHPITQGWLWQGSSPSSIMFTTPMWEPHVGPKGGGQWERVSWQEAINKMQPGRKSSPATAPRPYCPPTATAARSPWCRSSAPPVEPPRRQPAGASSICRGGRRTRRGGDARQALESTLRRRGPRQRHCLGRDPLASHLSAPEQGAAGQGVNSLSQSTPQQDTQQQLHLTPRTADSALALGLAHVPLLRGTA